MSIANSVSASVVSSINLVVATVTLLPVAVVSANIPLSPALRLNVDPSIAIVALVVSLTPIALELFEVRLSISAVAAALFISIAAVAASEMVSPLEVKSTSPSTVSYTHLTLPTICSV